MSAPKFFVAALVLFVGVSSEALAQRDAGAKIRGEFGTGFYSRPRSSTRSYRYQAPSYTQRVAPSAVIETAPPETAQAPTARRASRASLLRDHAAVLLGSAVAAIVADADLPAAEDRPPSVRRLSEDSALSGPIAARRAQLPIGRLACASSGQAPLGFYEHHLSS